VNSVKNSDPYHRQLIILGNGFDLALGLKTGYADYFEDKRTRDFVSRYRRN